MRAKRVAVIGGGWAGLAAAIEATRLGHSVTLFEMAPRLGGRARSVDVDGLALDNGQHILIGAYSATLALMRTVGVEPERVLERLPLTLVDANGAGLRLAKGAPTLAFVKGVLGRRGWSFGERIGLLATATRWMLQGFRCEPRESVDDLTRTLSGRVRAELIEPLCVAALNTPARDASGVVFLRVLKDALFSGPGSADLLLPRAGLSELLPAPAQAWLAARGAQIRLSCRVEQIEREQKGAEPEQWLVDGTAFDRVVLATTSVEASRLTRGVAPAWSDIAAGLRFEPIVTVYLRDESARLAEPMLALPADETTAPAQFVFDRGRLGGHAGVLAFVVSGAAPWVERGLPATVSAVRRQAAAMGRSLGRLAREPGGANPDEMTELRTFTEKRATFRCTPGLHRPPTRIASGFLAAGDYVDGPYPATLEGAVRSAIEAVALLDL